MSKLLSQILCLLIIIIISIAFAFICRMILKKSKLALSQNKDLRLSCEIESNSGTSGRINAKSPAVSGRENHWCSIIVEIISFASSVIALLLFINPPPEIYEDLSNERKDGDLIAPAVLNIKSKFPFMDIYYTIDGTDPAEYGQLYDENTKVVLQAGEGGTVCAKSKFLGLFWSDKSERSQRVFDKKKSPKYIDLETIQFDIDQCAIQVGEIKYLKLQPSPVNATEKQFFWTSDNAGIASVQGNGVMGTVIGHTEGVAKITATSVYNSKITIDLLVSVIPANSLSNKTSSTVSESAPAPASTPMPPPASTPASPPASTPTSSPASMPTSPPASMPTLTLPTLTLPTLIAEPEPEPPEPEPPEPEPPEPELELEPELPSVSVPKLVELECIEIETLPYKLEYEVGEEIDTTGLHLVAYYSDGTSASISNGFSCSPTYLDTPGEKTIRIAYQGKRANFSVKVNEVQMPVSLSYIYVKSFPNKTTYTVGEKLDSTGLVVIAMFSDGSSSDISNDCSISPLTLNTIGNQTIDVFYKGCETSFTVSVQAVPEKIRIVACDYRKSYESERKQSFFTILFETNVPYTEVCFSIGGQMFRFNGLGTTDGSHAFDRKFFNLSSYNITISVKDKAGNQDQRELDVQLGEITITMDPTNIELKTNETAKLTAYVTGLAGHSVKWECSNLSVDMSSDDVLFEAYSSVTITAKTPGQAIITASVAGKKCTCNIIVS